MIFHSSAPLHCRSALYSLAKRPVIFINRIFFFARLRLKNSAVVARWSHNLKVRGFESRNFIKIYIFNDFPQISTVKDFNFKLFRVLRGSTLRFDGSPLLYSTFHSNIFRRGVQKFLELHDSLYFFLSNPVL